eukprot:6492435-Amphidinium_carterae.1
MPHVSLAVSEVLRQALRETRDSARVIPFAEWVTRLGSLYKEDAGTSLTLVDSEVDMQVESDQHDTQFESGLNSCVAQCDIAVGTSDSVETQTDVDSPSCVAEENPHHPLAVVAGTVCPCAEASAEENPHHPLAETVYPCADAVETVKVLNASEPGGEYHRIVRDLFAVGVPMTKSRTNIGDCRSQLYGLYTKRGLGITSVTHSRPQVLRLLHELGRTRRDPTPYLAIAFNELLDVGVQEHVDANNESHSDLTAFGTFTGGKLCQLGEEIEVKGRWVRFFAQLPHSVTPTVGRRLSVSFFVPRLTHKVENSLWFALHEAGFPVQEHFLNKLPRVIACTGQISSLSSVACTGQINSLSHDACTGQISSLSSDACTGQISSLSNDACTGQIRSSSKKRDQESYCCTCGTVTQYECWFPGCECFVCTPCCRLYPDPEGGTTIACVHHLGQLPEFLSRGVSANSMTERDKSKSFCSSFRKGKKDQCVPSACSCKLDSKI